MSAAEKPPLGVPPLEELDRVADQAKADRLELEQYAADVAKLLQAGKKLGRAGLEALVAAAMGFAAGKVKDDELGKFVVAEFQRHAG